MNENRIDSIKEPYFIARLKTGDREAFDALYYMYRHRLYLFAVKHLCQPQDAEDLVQDVLGALWKNRFGIKHEDSLKAFLFLSLRNRIINFYRDRVNAPVYSDCVELIAHRAPASESSPAVEYDEFRRGMIRLISNLSTTEQRVLRLSRFGCKSNLQIAHMLGLSRYTVRNALSSGLRKLREKLYIEMSTRV